MAFSPDGKQLVTGSAEGIKIWDITPEGSRELIPLAGHSDVAFRLDHSPDGSLLATSVFDVISRVWELSSGKELHTLEGLTPLVYDAEFNIDGSSLVTSSYDGTVIANLTTFRGTFCLCSFERILIKYLPQNGVGTRGVLIRDNRSTSSVERFSFKDLSIRRDLLDPTCLIR